MDTFISKCIKDIIIRPVLYGLCIWFPTLIYKIVILPDSETCWPFTRTEEFIMRLF